MGKNSILLLQVEVGRSILSTAGYGANLSDIYSIRHFRASPSFICSLAQSSPIQRQWQTLHFLFSHVIIPLMLRMTTAK